MKDATQAAVPYVLRPGITVIPFVALICPKATVKVRFCQAVFGLKSPRISRRNQTLGSTSKSPSFNTAHRRLRPWHGRRGFLPWPGKHTRVFQV